VRRILEDLAVLIERIDKLIDQARHRVAGIQPDRATRLVSLHEPDARPVRKDRLGKAVEFGYKAQCVDNGVGLIVDYSLHIGNPADNELLRPAIERIVTRFSIPPTAVTADRGYWDSTIEADLTAAGVSTVVIPRTGKCSHARAEIEHADGFVAMVKWRTGCEGRISHLKRDWAWRRTRLRSHRGVHVWCGYGVFGHNLVKLTQLQR
jgi:IS5 family transposase